MAHTKYYQWTPDVEMSHVERCDEQGHVWRGAVTIFLKEYQACKWCGAAKTLDTPE